MNKTTKLAPNIIIGDFQILERDYTKTTAAIYWKIKCIHCGFQKVIRSSELKKYNKCKFCNDPMINQIYGDFTVLKRKGHKENSNNLTYECKCNKCGNIEEIVGSYLRSGRKKYCSKCHIPTTTLIDLTGQKFGFLTVLERDSDPRYYGHFSDPYWICKCNLCGSIKSIRGASLRKGITKSCGCIKSVGETTIASLLNEHHIKYKREYTFQDLYYSNLKNKLKFDFAIFNEDNTLSHLIEYDGIQHFEARNNGGWNTTEHLKQIQIRDKIKTNYCKEHKIKLIRIKYNEIITYEKIMGLEL